MTQSNSDLIENIVAARSLDEIDSLAFDVCYRLDGRSHALFEFEFEIFSGGKTKLGNISLISSRLNEQVLSPLIDKQLTELSSVPSDWQTFLSTHVWNTCVERWIPLASSQQAASDIAQQNRLTTTLCLLTPVTAQLFRGVVLKDVQNRMLDKKITDFHRLGSALAARAAMIQTEQSQQLA